MRMTKIIDNELYISCSKCNKLLHHTQFRNRSDGKPGKQSMCKICYNEYMRHYTRNYQGDYTRKKRIEIINKLGGKCDECGCDFEPILEIHHKYNDGYKERSLYGSWRTIINKINNLSLKELQEKYAIKCCVCHSKHHAELKYKICNNFTIVWKKNQT